MPHDNTLKLKISTVLNVMKFCWLLSKKIVLSCSQHHTPKPSVIKHSICEGQMVHASYNEWITITFSSASCVKTWFANYYSQRKTKLDKQKYFWSFSNSKWFKHSNKYFTE